ncbi:MAG: hypothetical protein COZ86_04650 [Candidatus Moranbacteria bacterium CG_4_8_14_3_um_filter_41_13]|nr:MAG: hypothetical protein COZ86_04650 [Candidatus Moranbacteria bacterium CG_4_8_14_3_um_filter_41_13]PJB99951.1 MAG: hypothetical protein CO075_03150 [Candidatus Moranbacteria bacterium CG_4_9_14_0_8_um_filter_41_43]
MYDVIIIGGGPGGVASGVYTARKQMKTLFLTESFQSQSTVSASIENWIGMVTIPGFEFAQSLENHLRAQEGIEIVTGVLATGIEKEENSFLVTASDGKKYETRTVIIASGGHHRHLGIPGEDTFNGKGVVYCSTCDAPFFRNKKTVVVGGGNAGLEAVEDLLPYAEHITLMVRSNVLKGDAVTEQKIRASEKVEILFNAVPKSIEGESVVKSLVYTDALTGEEKTLECSGVFVEIGMVPNSDFVKDLVMLSERSEIKIDSRTAETSVPGIFAVGDVTDVLYRQNNISAGYGVIAALAAYDFLRKK